MSPSFQPPKRILMGPGPSDIHPEVLQAMALPTIGHLDPVFVGLMDEIKELLQYAFQTKNQLTLPVSAPGSAGMETCFVNLVSPGDSVVVCINGVFGGRMKENVERCGAIPIIVEDPWGEPVNLQKVEQTLNQHPEAKILAFVHAETSTGAMSDARALAKLAQSHGCLTIVDTVTSLGGSPLKVDEWQLDAVYSGTQKCLSAPPGLSPVTFSKKAQQVIQERTTKVQSWFLDLSLVMGYWASAQKKRSYHHTAPINSLYALHQALVLLKEEGLENAWERHRQNHLALKAGLEAMGLKYVVSEADRLPQLNAVYLPEGVDDASVRGRLLEEYGLEIGGGLGALAGKVWRIGQMGYASRRENIELCIQALETVLSDLGAKIETGVALSAARTVYSS